MREKMKKLSSLLVAIMICVMASPLVAFAADAERVCTEDVRQHLVTGSTGGCDRTGTDYKRSVQLVICRDFSGWNVLFRIFL